MWSHSTSRNCDLALCRGADDYLTTLGLQSSCHQALSSTIMVPLHLLLNYGLQSFTLWMLLCYCLRTSWMCVTVYTAIDPAFPIAAARISLSTLATIVAFSATVECRRQSPFSVTVWTGLIWKSLSNRVTSALPMGVLRSYPQMPPFLNFFLWPHSDAVSFWTL